MSSVFNVPGTAIDAPGFRASNAIRSTLLVLAIVNGPSRSAEWNPMIA